MPEGGLGAWLATWRLYDVAHMAAAIYVALALFAKQQEPSLLQHSAMDFVNASAIPARQVRRSHARACARPVVRSRPHPLTADDARPQAIAAACAADPYQAAAAVVEFWLYVLVMGNSPIGWVVAIFFNSVTPAQWAAFLPWLVESFGSLQIGLTVVGCAAFSGT